MDWLLVPAGALLIFAGIVDVFFTGLHYDGFGFLSSRLYNNLYNSVRFVTRPLPRRYRAFGLSTAAPLMVPVTIVVWILLVSWGYALVYYAGMVRGDFSLSVPSLDPSFMESLYFSGITISEWLPFAHRNRSFYEALARDLGYELEGGPGELIF